LRCKIGSVDCEGRAAHWERGSKPCEIGFRDCELDYFSCAVGQGRGERSSFPGEQGAAVCGLADISWEMDSVSCEGSSPDVSKPIVADPGIWYPFGHEHRSA